jgi:hypothetical protein
MLHEGMNCVYLERRPDGSSLSSWITTAMAGLNAAYGEGLTAYIRWPQHRCPEAYRDAEAFARCPNMFEWYFRQPSCQEGHQSGAPIWLHGEDAVMVDRHPIENIHAFYQKQLLFNSDVMGRSDALLQKYSLRPENTIAVSWRGTDIAYDRPRISIDEYFPVIDEILDAEPDIAIFAKPEERGAAETLLQRFPKAIIPSEFFMANTGEKQMQDLVSSAAGYERGMQVALLILLFSRCKYLLINDANLSLIARWLSDGNVVNIRERMERRGRAG